MVNDLNIQQLLDLQKHEIEYFSVESHLKAIPKEKDSLEGKIASEKEALEKAQKAVQQLEIKLREVDLEREATREKIDTYKTQQLTVKTNEDYKALESEIAAATNSVHELEEEALSLMVEIEEEQAKLKSKTKHSEERIGEIEVEIKKLDERRFSLEEDLRKITEAIQNAKEQVNAESLGKYELVKNNVRHPPFIVPLENHKCQGCHLRVSNDIQIGVQHHPEEIHYCDQCGRILY